MATRIVSGSAWRQRAEAAETEVTRLEAERETARRWAVRLEGELARGLERERSQAILLERAEADREVALGRLASCSYEVSAFRHQRDQVRRERDEVVEALAALVAALDEDVTCEPTDERAARALVARYRPAPAPATSESHVTPE